jgi:hypothetical protein
LVEPLEDQLEHARRCWAQDMRDDRFEIALPGALARKVPSAARQFA